MNIYFVFFLLYTIGQLLSAMEKIAGLRKRYPEFTPKTIIKTFFWNEWNTLTVSGIIGLLCMLSLYIAIYNGKPEPEWFWLWGVYLFALVLGYAGQRLVYRFMKTTERALNERIDKG
jgi:fucose 4-O-acetylase-like acetyltransferase